MLVRTHCIRCLRREYSTKAPRAVRGMADRFGQAERKHQYIVFKARAVAESYGYEPVHTPILEYSSVFERTLGTGSDVVGKELYKFLDSSQDWMTMRPEGTASVNRAIISNKLEHKMPQKLFYSGPMFRHERPQKGRLRQFEQFGVEVLGSAHPATDVECIQMAWGFLHSLGIDGGLELQLNTLGDRESRMTYRNLLKEYFFKHKSSLSEDSQRRLETNPLRILDSKDAADELICAGAPSFSKHLSTDALQRFDFVQNSLASLGIPYTLNQKLVRGLDYYQHTVYEVTCSSGLLGKSQATVLAGGRYDGLSEMLGASKPLPGIGWAAGIERLALLILQDEPVPAAIPIIIVPDQNTEKNNMRTVSNELYVYAMEIASKVRNHRSSYVFTPLSFTNSPSLSNYPLVSKQLSSVLKAQPMPLRVIIVGSTEMANKTVVVRNAATSSQATVDVSDIESMLE
ncbi:hypothetical protein GGI25_004056 [Coemansia spiralis]|uniref:histidine--tRNA ligase n=2 Tax=Coemansia TaxID=4863 RepID=A0A9W8G7A4_9FUNG|nr:hypothetical protein BX070DRAFT_55166 [Coemansia spiralis]KAJ1991678.1 hypothetical protein EDC05_003303 [Coemansia umbellata]KAJ2620858.1 hypothetical protein GGI26_004653 [Coemansia sp. RSA 1358]KAJ2675216.1 hypothetical protein GGI25_004056 [Coemansia spiralis]